MDTEATESLAKAAWSRGDMEGAATVVYEAYGREIYSFLLAQPPWGAADDIFSQFNEDFWRGLPGFAWRSSIRAWCYRLARNASHRHRRSPHNDRRRHTPFTGSPWAAAALERERTSTRPHLQTEVKNEVQRLRERLSREDQDLLILRVDRNLSWRDVAHAMHGSEQSLDDEATSKREASFRQRYVEIKKRLQVLAMEAGLLSKRDRSQ